MDEIDASLPSGSDDVTNAATATEEATVSQEENADGSVLTAIEASSDLRSSQIGEVSGLETDDAMEEETSEIPRGDPDAPGSSSLPASPEKSSSTDGARQILGFAQRSPLITKQSLDKLYEKRTAPSDLLHTEGPQSIYNLDPAYRARVARYALDLFNWFVSVPESDLLVGIKYLPDVPLEFPLEVAQPRIFKRELCIRVADFWRQSKSLSAMALHFKLDKTTVLMALLFHAFNTPNSDVDIVPLLRSFEIDHNIYHMAVSCLLTQAVKEPPPKKRDEATANADAAAKENADEAAYIEYWADPSEIVCHCLMQPASISIMLYLAWYEATKGKEARVAWESLNIETTQVSVEQLHRFDKILEEAYEEIGRESEAEQKKIDELLTEAEKAVADMDMQMQAILGHNTGASNRATTNREEIAAIKSRKQEENAERQAAIEDILPSDFEEQRAADVAELEKLEQEVELLEGPRIKLLDVSKTTLRRDDLQLKQGDNIMARREKHCQEPFLPAIFHTMAENEETYLVRFEGDSEDSEVKCVNVALCGVEIPLMSEGIRVAALGLNLNDKANYANGKKCFYSGTIVTRVDLANRQYLIIFDDGFEGYAERDTEVFPLMSQAFNSDNTIAKEHVHNYVTPNPTLPTLTDERKEFVYCYFRKYPDWQLMRMKKGQRGQRVSVLNRGGQQWSAFVIDVDRQMCLLRFNPLKGDTAVMNCSMNPCEKHVHSEEWLYRGNPRFVQLKEPNKVPGPGESIARMPNTRRHHRLRQHQMGSGFESAVPDTGAQYSGEGSVRYANTARKTSIAHIHESAAQSFMPKVTQRQNKTTLRIESHPVMSENYTGVIYHNPCSHECLKGMDRDPSQTAFHNMSPFFIPVKCGWARLILHEQTRFSTASKKIVYYRTPCGRPLFNNEQIANFLQITRSELTIDLFTNDPRVNEAQYATIDKRYHLMPDFTEGKESRPLPVVNEVDRDPPPKFLYRARRYPQTEDVDMSTVNRETCSGCDCQDNCMDSTKCKCQMLTLETSKRLAKTLRQGGYGRYKYRRLENRGLSGIYECNDNCPCSRKRCFNRVVQDDIKVPLQMMKTPLMGWGVRTMVDLPKGTFICNYNGAILTDDLAEQWGEGDEYFADLDLMHAVEIEKANAGIDMLEDHGIGDVDNVSDAGSGDHSDAFDSGNEEGGELTEEEEDSGRGADGSEGNASAAGDQQKRKNVTSPLVVAAAKQDATVSMDRNENERKAAGKDPRESAQGAMDGTEGEATEAEEHKYLFEKYFSAAKKPTLYIVDAKSQGNLGRFLNHSCNPNCIVQHVMVDTHDLRLPWVSFFTSRFVKAGEELFWDYGWEPTEGAKRGVKCHCGSENCRIDLL